MATADELLAGSMGVVDPVLTIDWESRTIDIPKTITNLGVESDDDVKHLKFVAPRFYHGTDLAEFTIRINYLNANKEGDVYTPTDKTIGVNQIEFTWIVGRHATLYKGNAMFNVCAIITDNAGVIDKEVNTTPSILPVLEGLETTEALVEDEHDAMASVAFEAIQRALSTDLKGDSPVKGVDYFTPAEREEFAEDIIRDHNGAFANSLKGTASGSVIRVDDVSPVEHTVPTYIRSKNLANIAAFQIGKSISGSGIGDIINIIDNTTRATNPYIKVRGNTKYIFTLDNTNYFLDRICEMDEKGICTHNHSFYFLPDTNDYSSFTWTTKSNTAYIAVRLYNKNDSTPTVEELESINLMITEYEDETSGVYEPAIDPREVTVTRTGKNLLPPIGNTITVNGLKVIPQSNGRVVISGSITGDDPTGILCLSLGAADIRLKKNVPYKLTVYKDGSPFPRMIGTRVTYDDTGTIVWNTLGDITKDRTLNYVYIFHNDLAVGNSSLTGRYELQLEVGNEYTGWERYVEEQYTPDEYGFVDAASVSPTMTLMTDTPGVTIEAEYSKDINKMSFGGGAYVIELVSVSSDYTPTGVELRIKSTCDFTWADMVTAINVGHPVICRCNNGRDYTLSSVDYTSGQATFVSVGEYGAWPIIILNDGSVAERPYSEFGSSGGSAVASSKITNISLAAAAWFTEAESLHSQVVNVPGVTEYTKVDLLPSVAQLAIFHEKDVSFVTENEDGVVTVYAIGDKPTNDYTMQAQITEVSV